MAKTRKPSNNEKVVARIVALLKLEVVLTVLAFRGYYTIGRYTPAVGPRGFAVYGYGSIDPRFGTPVREFVGESAAEQAAWEVVNSCGSTRARDACIEAERKLKRALGGGSIIARSIPTPRLLPFDVRAEYIRSSVDNNSL